MEKNKWRDVFSENYPYMLSFIERYLGELRTKDFQDCMDLIEDMARNEGKKEGLKRAVEEVMREVRIGNLDLSDPKGWEKGYNDCLVKVLDVLKEESHE